MNTDRSIFKEPLFWAGFLAGGFILSLTLWYGMGGDSGVMSYCAWVWRHYQLPPYVGCIHADYPGIFIIHRLIFALFGERILDFRIFDFLVQFSGLIMIYYLARRLSQSNLAGFMACIFYPVYYYGLGASMTGQREDYVLWLILAALCLSATLERRIFLRAVGVGLVAGFAFLVKPFFGLLWPIFGVWFLVEGIRQRRQQTWIELVVFGACCLAPSLAVLAYYWHYHYLKDLYQVLVDYDFGVYARFSFFIRVFNSSGQPQIVALGFWSNAAYLVYRIFADQPLALAGALYALFIPQVPARGSRERRIYFLVLALIVGSLLSALLQGKLVIYHRVPFWGLAMILAGWGWARIAEQVMASGSLSRKVLYRLFCAGLVCLTLASIPADLIRHAARWAFSNPEQGYRAQYSSQFGAADYLKSRLGPQDQIYYFGLISQVPFLVKHKLPVPFLYILPMIPATNNRSLTPLQEEWKDLYIRTFLKTRPRFFIIDSLSFLALDIPGPKLILKEQFPQIQESLDRDYHLARTFGTYEIYELNPGPAKPGK